MMHGVSRGWISLVTVLWFLYWPGGVSAHLLNMSRVEIDIRSDPSVRTVQVQLDLDLTVALGGAERFHAASQADDPLTDTDLAALAQQVADGLDHLLFVAGLFLGCLRLSTLVGLISTYTLAHTITLGMAALSWVELSGSIVEPIIALSIAWIAIENLRSEPGPWWRLAVVFLFGLVHGLGFAEALKDAGLPADGTLWALAGFNAGVELGQLTWIGLLLMVLGYWRSRPGYDVWVVRPASVAIGIVALFWTWQRLMI